MKDLKLLVREKLVDQIALCEKNRNLPSRVWKSRYKTRLLFFTEKIEHFFSSNQRFTKAKRSYRKQLISRKFLIMIAFYSTLCSQCTLWKLRNFTATIFSQKFRQIDVLLKNFTISWFDGKKFAWQWIFHFSTLCSVEKQDILSHQKNISSNQLFSDLFSKTVTFTKFLPKISESKFP